MFLKALEIQGFKSFPDRTRITVGKASPLWWAPTAAEKAIYPTPSAGCWRDKRQAAAAAAARWRTSFSAARSSAAPWACQRQPCGGQHRQAHRRGQRRGDDRPQVLPLRRQRIFCKRAECRLKDIYELFLDTGLGRDGYSVIGQGRIAEIVGAKSNERREIFEEASGIAKYRYRKMRPSAAWPPPRKIWCACGISWASWRSAWARWSGRAKRQSSI